MNKCVNERERERKRERGFGGRERGVLEGGRGKMRQKASSWRQER